MDNNQPAVLIQNQYIKDLSMEIPHAPDIFKKMQKNNPKIGVEVNLASKPLEDNVFDVMLNIAVNGDVESEKAFILELSYGAVVSVNVPKEHLEGILMVEVPHMIFPFARQIVANTMSNAGLPPLMLNPIDFMAMFIAKKNKQAAQ